jgi:hypothetical protein
MRFMYFYCYGYVFSLYVYVWLTWMRFSRAFSSVVRQMPGCKPQRRGTARILPNFCVVLLLFVLFYVLFVSISVLFVCICVLYYCHRVATQLQLNTGVRKDCTFFKKFSLGPWCDIRILCPQERRVFQSKVGVSSSNQCNLHHSPHTVHLEKKMKKDTIFSDTLYIITYQIISISIQLR